MARQACEIGNAAAIPLGISSSDVQLGDRLHDTPQSSVNKVCTEAFGRLSM